MARTLTVLLVLAALAAPSQAQAGWRMQRATEIAAKVWHDPCDGNVTVVWTRLPEVVAGMELECTVTLPEHAHMAWVDLCTVMIHEYGHAAGYRDPTNTADPDHSSDPNSVMTDGKDFMRTIARSRFAGRPHRWHVTYSGYDRRCADRGRTYLGLRPTALASHERFARIR